MEVTTVKLRSSPSLPSSSSGGGGKVVSFDLPSLDSGVNLVAIGEVLGLDPPTVRLNGHFLSRGSDGVSSVTWRTLLSFFSSRGFPSGGADGGDPVQVEGKPLPRGTRHDICRNGVMNVNNFHKRKYIMDDDDEKPSKKEKSAHCDQSHLEDANEIITISISTLSLKRKLSLDDEVPLKKRKGTESVVRLGVINSPGSTMMFSCMPTPSSASKFSGLCQTLF